MWRKEWKIFLEMEPPEKMTDEQLHLLKLLEHFSDLCRKNNLRYYLAGGTLLGAVRHQGFIPWDDDIDILMPVDDYNRFLKLEESLFSGVRILSELKSEDYPFFFCELCDTKIPFNTQNQNGPAGVYIDIFPLVPSRRPSRYSRFCFNVISEIGYVLQVKTRWTQYVPYKKGYARAGYHLLNLLSKEILRRLREKLIDMLSKNDTNYCFSPGGGHKGTTEFYPKAWFEERVLLSFEGKKFSAPCGWDQYLKQLYGDYMTLPDTPGRKSVHRNR